MFDSRLQVGLFLALYSLSHYEEPETMYYTFIEINSCSGQDHQTCGHLLWWRERIQSGWIWKYHLDLACLGLG